MVKIYGCSDDLVECEGAEYPNDEIGCYNKDVLIAFEDGTVIKVGYPKAEGAIWWIERMNIGTADYAILYCHNEDDDPYSDIFVIDSDIQSVELLPKEKDYDAL